MEQMHEITFGKLNDGTIHLEQSCGLEEPSVIHLHPEQLQFISRRVCGLNEATAAKVQDLERKLSVLADRMEKLVDAEWFRNSIAHECPDGIEILCRLDGILDLAVEFDGGRLLPNNDDPQEAATSDLKDIGGITRQVRTTNATQSESAGQIALDV